MKRDESYIDGQWCELGLAEVERDLFAEGKELARRSGAREPQPGALEALQSLADKAAARLSAAPYQPGSNIADENAEARYRTLRAIGEELQQQVAYARAAWRDRASELAALGDRPVVPPFPLLVAIAGVLAIGLTIAPTLHDLIFVTLLAPGGQAFGAALGAGALIGALLVWGMLSGTDSPTAGKGDRVVWTVLGIAFGVALYLMRSAHAAGWAEQLFSIGLAILEAVFVLLVERVAARRAEQILAVQEALHTHTAARAQLAQAREYLDDRLHDVARNEELQRVHEAAVRQREHLVRAAPKLQEAARAAVRAGYEAGLAANRGVVNDGAFLPPTASAVIARTNGHAVADATKEPS